MSILKDFYGFCDSGRDDCPYESAAATVADVRHHMRFSGWKKISGQDWCDYCVQSRTDEK